MTERKKNLRVVIFLDDNRGNKEQELSGMQTGVKITLTP